MSEPPEPIVPQKLNYATPAPPEFDLDKIARWQRWLGFSMLVFLASISSAIVAGNYSFHLAVWCLLIGACGAALAVLFIAVVLALAVRRASVAILLVVSLLLFPLFILLFPVFPLMLLSISGSATRILRKHGVRVGLFGAVFK